jgi:chemotaxis protein MotB
MLCKWMCTTVLACSAMFLAAGCNSVPQQYLQQSQLRTQMLYKQNQQLLMQRDGYSQSAGALSAENQSLKQNLEIANRRLENLQSSNSQLEQRVKNLLTSARAGDSPLSDDATRRLEELKRKYPQFEFDPATGVSKFNTDLLFATGSDEINHNIEPVLSEFSNIMNGPDAQHLRVLVVGHTDDKPISKANTKAKHPTNWHLSTDRANSVVLALKKHGIHEKRMEAAGCSMFQPVAPNTNDESRRQNRRVEIFVLAPDAAVAGWDPASRIE